MKKRSVVALLVLSTVFLFFVTTVPVHAQGKAMKLRLSVQWPPQHPITKMIDQWGKDVEKATAGRITVIFLSSCRLAFR